MYPTMGFDEMHFIDYFDQNKILRKYITDQELYEKIIDQYESKSSNEDLFIMSISMQNHGGYTETYDNFNEQIRTLGTGYADANQYLSLLHESDKALEYLISYFENVDDPVEIVFFGAELKYEFLQNAERKRTFRTDGGRAGASVYRTIFHLDEL